MKLLRILVAIVMIGIALYLSFNGQLILGVLFALLARTELVSLDVDELREDVTHIHHHMMMHENVEDRRDATLKEILRIKKL